MNRGTPCRLRIAIGGLLIAACLAVCVTAVLHGREEVVDASSLQVDTSRIPKPLNPRANTVAFMGDSYTAGSGSGGYNHAFATLVAAYEGWTFRNFAYGGTGYVSSVTTNAEKGCGIPFCPAYGAVVPQVTGYNPTVVIVTGGRNDVGRPQSTIDAKVDDFYRTLREKLPKARIIATSPIWDSRVPPSQMLKERADVKRAVDSVHGDYLDLEDPLRGHRDLISGDGVHPNADGHAVIAKAVEVAISRNDTLARALKAGV